MSPRLVPSSLLNVLRRTEDKRTAVVVLKTIPVALM